MKCSQGFIGATAAAAVMLALITSVATIQGYTATVITDPIMSPLPSRPEPVIAGGSLIIRVKAGEGAEGWSANLLGDWGAVQLTGVDSDYIDGRGWTVMFQVPVNLPEGLYDMRLSYSDEGKAVDVTQSRCVWAMEEWPESLNLIHISDIHEPVGKNLYPVFIFEANLLNPDLVIVSGDIVDVETIAAAWNYLQYTTLKLEAPSYMLPGNHDYSGASSNYYRKYWGPVNYTVTIGDFLLVTMSSTGEGFVSMDQLTWADKVLRENPDKVKILSYHHPLLSSEYEDDFGVVRGGEITGSYTDMEALESLMYPSWRAKMSEATELLRIIESNDVRLILSGHVHRDMIYILNNRHYFVTTTTISGGLSPGSYYGYRSITIDNQGNVELDEYASTRLFDPPNSIPSGHIKYVYKNANDGSSTAVTAHVENGLNMTLNDARLEFTVSSAVPPEEYGFSTEPDSYTVTTTPEGHVFTALVDILPRSELDLTLSAGPDSEEPTITFTVPDSYAEGEQIRATIDVSDSGWGVKSVEAWYRGDEWTLLELPDGPVIDGDHWKYTFPSERFNVTLPGLGGEVTLKVEAVDYAGNFAQAETTVAEEQPLRTYTLTVNTQPSGINVMVNGNSKATPYSEALPEGTYVVEVAPSATVSGKEYRFKQWGTGETDNSRAVALDADKSLTVVYEEVRPPEPSGGIPVPALFVAAGLASALLLAGRARRR
jgi:3',5'-cyclic AMP phosphodiesterase CpdA